MLTAYSKTFWKIFLQIWWIFMYFPPFSSSLYFETAVGYYTGPSVNNQFPAIHDGDFNLLQILFTEINEGSTILILAYIYIYPLTLQISGSQ
jgi:hypothetical protein